MQTWLAIWGSFPPKITHYQNNTPQMLINVFCFQFLHLFLLPFSTLPSADLFSSFFTDKVSAISDRFSEPDQLSLQLPASHSPLYPRSKSTNFYCCLLSPYLSIGFDNHSVWYKPLPPYITNSLIDVFSTAVKRALITLLFKKPTLHHVQFENSTSVSFLSFLLKFFSTVSLTKSLNFRFSYAP